MRRDEDKELKMKRAIHSCLTILLLCSYAIYFTAWGQSQEDAVGIVLDVLKSDDQEMQAVAISMVKEMPGTEITKALAEELPNLQTAIQVQLLSALGDRGDPAALPAVITATKAEDTSVRIAALRALGQLGDASSVILLVQKAAQTGGAEQKAAREGLYRLHGPKVDETILETIQSANPQAKVELIRSVGERNITAGIETLLKTAKDSEARVRLESLKTLKTIADEKHVPALVELLIAVQSQPDRREAERTVAAVARKIGDKDRRAEAVLAVLPSVHNMENRCSLLRVLGKIGDNSALPTLHAALNDKDAKVKDVAIRALSDWPTAEPMADLLKVAQTSDNNIHRLLALRGYIRLVGLDSNRPAEETVKMYAQAMNLALDVSEKKMVLSGLANVKSLAALEMAASHLQDAALQQEAEVAVVKIAEGVYEGHPQRTNDVLNKVIQISKNAPLRQKAQEVLTQIRELKTQAQN